MNNETIVEPLTRNEREDLKKLSQEAYGKPLQWQKLLKKGEMRPEVIQTSSGNSIQAKRLHYFTLNEIKLTMKKILVDREEAAKKAEAERSEKRQAQQDAERALALEAGKNADTNSQL